jgi:GT2 family glycosyltransferase
VVDNASTDNTVETIKSKFPNVRIIVNTDNYGYAKACNIGVFSSTADNIILSNSDIIYKDNSIKLLNDKLNDPKTGIIGPQQFFPNGRFQRSAGFAPGLVFSLFELGFDKVYRNLCWNMNTSPQYPNGYIDGGVLAFKKETYEVLNGMDEDFFFYAEEADLCFRAIKKGYRNSTIIDAEVIHLRGSSSDTLPSEKSLEMLIKGKKLFLKKHRNLFERKLAVNIEKYSYLIRWWLSDKNITLVPDSKKALYRAIYEAWKVD